MTFSVKGLFVTLRIKEAQHVRHSAQQNCYYAEVLCAEYRILLIVMLIVFMLSVVAPF
jgi:hypothetical protein